MKDFWFLLFNIIGSHLPYSKVISYSQIEHTYLRLDMKFDVIVDEAQRNLVVSPHFLL